MKLDFKKTGQPWLWIAVVVFIIFGPVLRNGYVGDDEIIFLGNDFYHSAANLGKLFSPDYFGFLDKESRLPAFSGSVAYRPLVSLTFFVDALLWGQNPAGAHLQSLLWHCLNAVLVFWIFSAFFRDRLWAGIAALLFALHPVHVEAVSVIGYRSDLVATAFGLGSLALYIRSTSSGTPPRARDLFGISALYGLALFAKESAIVFPILFFVYDGLIARLTWTTIFRQRRMMYLFLLATSAYYLHVYFNVFPNTQSQSAVLMGGTYFTHAMTALWSFVLYGLWMIFPPAVTVVPPLYAPVPPDPVMLYGIAGFLFFGGCWGLVYFWRDRQPPAAFGIGWFFLALLPVSHIIPLVNPVAHRFLYLPSVGGAVCAAVILMEVTRRLKPVCSEPVRAIVPVAAIIMLMGVTISRIPVWDSTYTVSKALIREYPDHPKAYSALGLEMLRYGERDQAQHYFQKAIERGTNDPRVYRFFGETKRRPL